MTKPTSVENYFAGLAPEQAAALTKVRDAIHRGIPDWEERISYSMPAVVTPKGIANLHFAAWKTHVGIYPVHGLSPELEKEVAPYRRTKHMLGFSYADGVPEELIERVAAAVVARS
ncbi:MAG: DUF1801 domain-containing protein [Solirubrobacterales bacterium]